MRGMTGSDADEVLQRARNGDQSALGKLLRHYDPLLLRMARREIGERLQARLSAADIVQQSCLSAIRNLEEFRGKNHQQFAAWLCEIHERNLRDMVRRHVRAQKRAVAAQEGFSNDLDEDARAQTPSQRAVLGESAEALRQAIGSLPDDQATAIRLRHLQQQSLDEIATQMDRSDVAVASLLKRGLAGLRQQFGTDPENP